MGVERRIERLEQDLVGAAFTSAFDPAVHIRHDTKLFIDDNDGDICQKSKVPIPPSYMTRGTSQLRDQAERHRSSRASCTGESRALDWCHDV